MPWCVFQSSTLMVDDVEAASGVVVWVVAASGISWMWSIDRPSSRVWMRIRWLPVVAK